MASINISNLRSAGLELFSDSESYMKEMTEGELSGVLGGDDGCASIDRTLGLAGAGAIVSGPLCAGAAVVGWTAGCYIGENLL